MDARYYIDPVTDEPHIYRHAITEREVEDVLGRPIEDRPGRDGSPVASHVSSTSRKPGAVFVITAYELGLKALRALRRTRRKKA